MKKISCLLLLGFALLFGTGLRAQEQPKVTRTEDVIYGRKFGMALTLDVFEPEKKNGAAVFWIVSSGYSSGHQNIKPAIFTPLLERGYTVIAVVHGSQPRFIVPLFRRDSSEGVWPCFVSFGLKGERRVVALASWPADYGSNTQERCTM